MSSVCPGLSGLTSRKATASSVSSTRADGISPRTILQKMQCGSCGGSATIGRSLDSRTGPKAGSAGLRAVRNTGRVHPLSAPTSAGRRDDGGAHWRLDLLVLSQQADHGHRRGVALADPGELVDAGVAA